MTTSDIRIPIYIPTEDEMSHLRFLRSELCWADRKLSEARENLAQYESDLKRKAVRPARKARP